jgi:hypothetical protein
LDADRPGKSGAELFLNRMPRSASDAIAAIPLPGTLVASSSHR